MKLQVQSSQGVLYTFTSSYYNTNMTDFMDFVKAIEDIFQQSMNDPVARTLISITWIDSTRSGLELSLEDIQDLNFGVYNIPIPILFTGSMIGWLLYF